MIINLKDPLILVIMATVFLLVLSLWAIGLLLWWGRRADRAAAIQKRLQFISHPEAGPGRVLRLWRDGEEATTLVPGSIHAPTFLERLELLRQAAAIQTPLATLILGTLGFALLAALAATMLAGQVIVGLVTGFLTIFVAVSLFKRRAAQQQALFDRQLVDALELAARSLRAGHPLVGSFRLIADEIPAPVGTLFAEVYQQQNLGVALAESLRKAANASSNDDLKLFSTSVIIQLRSGGNLADMMDRLAFVIRDRMRLGRRIRVLTSQTQFSKRILLALPFLIFVILNIINPKYMGPLYTTVSGEMLLVIAAGMLFLGAYVMNRLAIIRY